MRACWQGAVDRGVCGTPTSQHRSADPASGALMPSNCRGADVGEGTEGQRDHNKQRKPRDAAGVV